MSYERSVLSQHLSNFVKNRTAYAEVCRGIKTLAR